MNKSYLYVTSALVLSNSCFAETSPFYIGADISNAGKTNSEVSDTAFGGQILLGYDLSETWSAEASMGSYGNLDTIKEGEYRNTVEKEKFSATDISLLGSIPLSHRYDLYGGIGMQQQGNDWAPIGQVGVHYQLNDLWKVKFGYKFILSEDSEKDLQVLSFGVRYHFPKNESRAPENVDYDEISVASTSKMVVYEPIDPVMPCEPSTYLVQQDDWLIKIALRHKIDFKELKRLNHGFTRIDDINLIYPGDVVLIPNNQCD